MDLQEGALPTQDFTMIKCFHQERAVITAVNYGPFDNGHICLGFNTGHVLILSSFDLASIYRTQVFYPSIMNPSIPVKQLIFDPLNMILATSDVEQMDEELPEELTYRPLLAGISLIDTSTQYKYVQMGMNSYMTIIIPD